MGASSARDCVSGFAIRDLDSRDRSGPRPDSGARLYRLLDPSGQLSRSPAREPPPGFCIRRLFWCNMLILLD